MRRDIQVNTNTGDVVLHGANSRSPYPFEWIKEEDLFVFGQITLPSHYDIAAVYQDGVHISIPYTPIYKKMKIKIVRDFGSNQIRTEINPVDGSEWFDVKAKLYSGENKDLYAPQLLMINQNDYLVKVERDTAYIWSDVQLDFENVNANIQNRNLLLSCVPSNSYRFPTSGVGLIQFLHSNMVQSGLAEKLQKEFEADGVKVVNAAFDSYTGNLELELNFAEADAGL